MNLKDETLAVANAAISLPDKQIREFKFEEPRADKIRVLVRNYLTRKGLGGNIVLSVSKDKTVLVVFHKEKSYTQKLEEMLRRTMFSIEDEGLFNECLKLLEENNG